MAQQRVPRPVFRRLRVFAVDPGMTARFETAVMNEMTLAIPWEELEPGPAGEYVKVVDQNDQCQQLHDPVDLNRPEILAQDGLAPSDGNPQFRQQMVYAVSMRTIRTFERALGRVAHWPLRQDRESGRTESKPVYEKQIRIYPHYLENENAYYDPAVGFCFGYFQSGDESPFPGTTIFTCLSQDVIAHELTHALLDGMQIRFQGLNPDVAAFHEAFSDIVPLLQHFWPSDVLLQQVAAVRGHLEERSSLGAVAPQFGQAIGRPDGIRNALGYTDNKGAWHRRIPDPKLYLTEEQPHNRGDILVGAIFEAFRKIYESRVTDLRRIATKGTGILPRGSLHPDLVNRFAQEASRTAQRVLELCIRALDYIPPVEITFGDYLRAIITADYDVAPIDEAHLRVAFIDGFRSYGILPSDVGTLSQETLLLRGPPQSEENAVSEFVRRLSQEHTYWNLPRDRKELWTLLEAKKAELHEHLKTHGTKRSRWLGPINLSKPFEVQSFHPHARGAVAGDLSFQWVVKIVQSTRAGRALVGLTVVLDAKSGRARYHIESSTASKKSPKGRRAKGTKAIEVTEEKESDILKRSSKSASPMCSERRLRVFAFDPSLGIQLETAGINEVAVRIPWERDESGTDILEPGPVGEYFEVVDRDPASGCFYEPVNLNDPHLLAQDGLPPSESNPQFHQQMVYAVAMRTVRNFERALGRLALWSPNRIRGEDGKVRSEEFVQRLRIYPHALREPNAYYSPTKKALLFGYFPAPAAVPGSNPPRLTVFTCLSHDIIAHEVTHALLDGMHRRFSEASNPDVLAFHEAFADLVALFQHFSLPGVLRHQIVATRGDLASQNQLGQLAQQFGQAIGKRGALRSAIGGIDPSTGKWRRGEPDPQAYSILMEPHDRGSVLVAAVFDAFLAIYKARVADLLRIATEGTGVLPAGHLNPDLVTRLSDEAARSARHVLEMCIRALDYCPPVDITFGDYLRAIVTADFEYDPVDQDHRRVAFIEAFRQRGIVPEDVRAFSVDGLLWRPTSAAPDEDENVVLAIVRRWAGHISSWELAKSRPALFGLMSARRAELHNYLKGKLSKETQVLSGVDPTLTFEVHSVRPSIRTDWEGGLRFQWVIELTQRIPQYIDSGRQRDGARPDYYFRGGCTLLVDAETGKVQFSIKKRLDAMRKERQRHYFMEDANTSLAATYFGGVASENREPFAMLHRL